MPLAKTEVDEVEPLSIALNRFGLGGRNDEAPPEDARRWLLGQFDRYNPRPSEWNVAPGSVQLSRAMAAYYKYVADPAVKPGGGSYAAQQGLVDYKGKSVALSRAVRLKALDEQRDAYTEQVGARMTSALNTEAPFIERLVHFWANHFTVSADKLTTHGLAGTIEGEAIRPHILGRFADMLIAVEQHPAMLFYLDQAASFGPLSEVGRQAALRGRKLGLNENLAREVLELHTLGVAGGYTQHDVTELARAMTGMSVAVIGSGRSREMTRDLVPGQFMFLPALHEPGARSILGKTYPARSGGQAESILRDLAVHPSTAKHLATKLARHFAGDEPPPSLIERLSAGFVASGGDLPGMYRLLIEAPETWVRGPVKFKSPWEWMTSSYRAVGVREIDGKAVAGLASQLGQPVWKAGQPSGYDDVAVAWAGPDAIMRRVEAAERLAARTRDIDVTGLVGRLFPGSLSMPTEEAIRAADSNGQAIALLLVSPEAMRR